MRKGEKEGRISGTDSEMEVVIPVPATDFHFDSSCSSPHISAPPSPKRFGDLSFYLSAPTSPTRASSSSITFDWEKKTGRTKSGSDFQFDFSGQLEKAHLAAAEELFDHGKIRPLKPPPRLQIECNEETRKTTPVPSPKSPERIFRDAFSPSGNDFDPFEAETQETRKESERERGRERGPGLDPPPDSSRRATRSLSPFRFLVWDSKPTATTSSSSLKGGSSKWKLKDFLLFRSVSEGRAKDKNALRKYLLLSKKGTDDVKNGSVRSTDSGGSNRGGGPVSAHELHYTANRAVSAELKKKTFLPYRRGLLGCLGFNPTAHRIDSCTRVR